MDMKIRLLPLPLIIVPALLAGLLLAGCGGGGSASVPSDAVALVGSTPITKAQFDQLMTIAEDEDKAAKKAVPKVGTTAYTQLRDQAVGYLVQASELEQEAKKMGVSVGQKDINAQFKQIEQQYYGGSKKKFVAGLKKSGLTLAQYTQLQRVTLLAQKVNKKVTSGIKVSKADAKNYYKSHKSTYSVPETREVRHILVDKKSLADQLETKLKNGASFVKLVKKYSKDTSTVAQGGKLCVAHGGTSGSCVQTVSQFDKAAFSLKTHEISQPVHSQYGWHIIQALSPITPAHTPSFSKVAGQIQSNLLQTKQNSAWQAWINNLQKDFTGKVTFQTGYQPATTATSTSSATTTG
jgi:foldase protein PrsA